MMEMSTMSTTGEHMSIKKIERIKQKIAEKEKEKERRKMEKLEQKRKERLEKLRSQPPSEDMLKAIDSEIIESLNVENMNISRCLSALSKLDFIQMSAVCIRKYPGMLVTLKKCRKFKEDEKIRQKSDYLYNKFKSLFLTDHVIT